MFKKILKFSTVFGILLGTVLSGQGTVFASSSSDQQNDNFKFPGVIFETLKDSEIAKKISDGAPKDLKEINNADQIPLWWGDKSVDLSWLIGRLKTNPYTVYFDVNNQGDVEDIIRPTKENNYAAQIKEHYYYIPNELEKEFSGGPLGGVIHGAFNWLEKSWCENHSCPEVKPFLTEENVDNNVTYAGVCDCEIKGSQQVSAGCSLATCDPQYIKEENGVKFCSLCIKDLWNCKPVLTSGAEADPDFMQKKKGYTNCVNVDQVFNPFLHENYVYSKSQKDWVFSKKWVDENPGPDLDGDGNPDGNLVRVIRPVNNDVVKVSYPRCYEYKKTGLLTETKGINCYSNGLSADLRVGNGKFNYEKTGFGGLLGGLLSIFLLALPFLNIIISVFWAITSVVVGFVGAASFAITQATMATIPSAYGTVDLFENNPASVGFNDWTWTWNKIPPILLNPEINFKGPAEVEYDDQINLSWSVKNAVSCTASGDWNGDKAAAEVVTQERFVKGRGTYKFILTCKNEIGISSKTSVDTKVIEIPKCEFTANPSSIVPKQTSTLSWECRFADSCKLNNNPVSVSDSEIVSPPQTTTYDLLCKSEDGSRNFSATVAVDAAADQNIPWWQKAWWKEILPR